MDDHVEITDEELDRLIAEVSGGCDVADADNDFDIVSEFDELNNTSELPTAESIKNVTAADLKNKEDRKKTGNKIEETASVKKKEEENVLREAEDAVSVDGKRAADSTADVEKKEEETVKTNLTAATEITSKSSEDGEKKVSKKEAVEATEGKNITSEMKSLKEKEIGTENKDSVKTGTKKTDGQDEKKTDGQGEKKTGGQGEKMAGDRKKEGGKIKSTEETLRGAEKNIPVGQNTGKSPPAKGTKGSQTKTGAPSTAASGKPLPGKSVAESRKKDGAKTGGKETERGGKEIETGGAQEAAKEKSLSAGERRRTADSSFKDKAAIEAELFDAVSSVLAPIQGAKGKASPAACPSPGVPASGKVEEAVASSPSAVEKEGTERHVEGEIHSDMGSKSNQDKTKKGGAWGGWSNIGSWGSSVLNQVGGGLYHVLESVESSLVEPETKASVKGNSRQDSVEAMTRKEKSGDGETGEDVVLFQPSSGNEDESKVPVKSDTKDENRSMEWESGVASGGKIEDTGVEAAEETPDQKKKLKKKLNSSKGQSRDQSSEEQSWFSGWGFSAITGAVQQTGKKVVSSGMDVLGNISRKTMSVLADEPEDGVAPLSPSSSSPSQSVSSKRRNKSDAKRNEKSKAQMLRKCFDDCQGLAHFDALNDLNQMSQEKLTKRLERISGDWLSAVKADLALIEGASDLGGMDWEENFGDTDHDFHQLIKDFISQLGLSTNTQKLFNVQETTSKWLSSCLRENPQDKKYAAEDIHKMAILMFADFTATGIAQFHKIAQLLLVDYSAPILSYKFRALSLAGLTKVLCTEIWIEARRFTDCLNQPELMEPSDVVMSMITNLTLEASNCSSCLQDGYRLLLPIVQLAALKVHPLMSDCSEIANLEVLQLMSSMSRSKVSKIMHQLTSDPKQSVQSELSTIEAAFDLSFLDHENDGDQPDLDFGPVVLECLRQIGVDINSQKLLRANERTQDWLLSCETGRENSAPVSPSDINQMALKSLNDLTSSSIELFHQIGQVLLMENPREISAYSKRASAVKELTKILCLEVGRQSTKFTNCILKISNRNEEDLDKSLQVTGSQTESVTPFVTNIYLEASSSTTYIHDGFLLLLPIIQLALFKAHPACAGLDG